jgi:hypothetical protein
VKVDANISIDDVSGGCDGVVRGRVLPNAPGSNVKLQAKRAGSWRTVARDELNGRSRFVLGARDCGKHRVVWLKQTQRAETGVRALTIR